MLNMDKNPHKSEMWVSLLHVVDFRLWKLTFWGILGQGLRIAEMILILRGLKSYFVLKIP